MRLAAAAMMLGVACCDVHAITIVAQCEELRGPRVDYRDDYSSGQHVLQRGEDNFGPRTYVWDSTKPDVLQVLKAGRIADLQEPGEVSVEYYDVAIITTGAIVAVEVFGNGVYTHTLWPERGFFLMSRTSAQTTGAVGAMYFAKCAVKVRD